MSNVEDAPPEPAPPTNYCPGCRYPVLLRDSWGTCGEQLCRAFVERREREKLTNHVAWPPVKKGASDGSI